MLSVPQPREKARRWFDRGDGPRLYPSFLVTGCNRCARQTVEPTVVIAATVDIARVQ